MAVGTLLNVKVDAVNGMFSAKFTADGTPSASSIFCGFTPRVVEMTQIGGTPGATSISKFHESMTAGYAVLISATGAMTIPTTNGYTLLSGSEAAPAAAATNSPNSGGTGFTLGTGVQGASLVYLIEAYR